MHGVLVMGALTLGLIAAFSWGVHDTMVRYISQKVGVFRSLFPVLLTGTLVTTILAFALDTGSMTGQARVMALLSGLVFGVTGVSFFAALAIGPVRVVAPVVASFPILSVAWAVANGQSVTMLQWLAVLVIVGGCGFAAMSSADEEAAPPTLRAVLWSVLAAVGFALSFALGQLSVADGTELTAIAIARVGAVGVVVLIALILRKPVLPVRSALPILLAMGLLDAIAIGAVMVAGNYAYPAFASVGASIFGVLTIIFASIFLKEPVTRSQWMGIVIVFVAIGYLAL
jgi:drug/metabolite transporter (DMT)-like permease